MLRQQLNNQTLYLIYLSVINHEKLHFENNFKVSMTRLSQEMMKANMLYRLQVNNENSNTELKYVHMTTKGKNMM